MSALAERAPAARPSRPRLAFLGVGWIGRHRLQAVAEGGLAEIAALVDPSAEMVSEAARIAPGARGAASLDELDLEDLDGVVIATPTALHAEQAIAALDRGLAVFCQKPLGRNAAEVAAVIAAARRADRLLGVDLSYRHTAAMRAIRERLAAGAIGEVHAIDLVFHNAYGPDKAWFYDPRLSGGGCVVDLGVHLVDLVLWALDLPEVRGVSSRLFAGGRPLVDPGSQVEDYAVATLDLEGGAVARLACSWRLQAGCDAVISASFYGTGGGLEFRNVGGSFYDFVAVRFAGPARETLTRPPDDWGGRAAADWAGRLAAGEGFDEGVCRQQEVARVLDAIYGR